MKEPALLYSSFNARQLTPEEVAETFVAPPQYEQLCKTEHTLLLGPRGSGKTTLLKMLTAPALRAWVKKGDVEVRELPFKSIYVPADVLWTAQLEDIGHQGLDDALAETLVRAAVTANVQYSLIEAFEHLDETLRLSERESAVATEVAQEWQLPGAFPSYYGLRKALKSRVGSIRTLVGALQHVRDTSSLPKPIPEFVHVDFWQAASIAIEIYEHVYSLPGGQRWALCFDELEISPEWLRRRLLESLRSTEQRFILKLSASPMQPGAVDPYRPAGAQEGQDYRVVKLWYTGPAEARTFCHRLTQRTLSRAFGRSIDPHEVLGHSTFAQDDGDSLRTSLTYQPGSRFWKDLRAAANEDPSLKQLLKDRGIDPSRPEKTRQADRDQFLRKIRPVLMLRNEFRAGGNIVGRQKTRSRKLSTLYAGAEAVYALSDGNPRWLIGMLGDILSAPRTETKVSKSAQAAVLWRASHRFKALVGMLPKGSRQVGGREIALVDIIDAVGAYFFDRLVRQSFPVDPVGSFIVDARTSDALVELIQLGVSQGALVYVETDWKIIPANPRGKRFRLSFMLGPSYRLPLRLYEPVALSLCLKETLRTRVATNQGPVTQAELFGGEV